MTRLLFAAASLLCLSACGWHLRGQDNLTHPGYTAIALTAEDPYTRLYRDFRFAYEQRRLTLDDPSAFAHLHLIGESLSSRILSLNTELNPAENELSLQLNYRIRCGAGVDQPFDLRLYRIALHGDKTTAAIDNEQQRLAAEMRIEASDRILNQLMTLCVAPSPPDSPG